MTQSPTLKITELLASEFPTGSSLNRNEQVGWGRGAAGGGRNDQMRLTEEETHAN